ncbi:MAG: DNA-binding domain of ModE / Molybdate-binding domain of ModE [Candidatus Jettenia ecosi]|uniref:DNA-binding domain of ModE / Molybdate-binding domain of ModE n=1 Tax=Candidatus Jettenia ecosi TaxID=2494326 RepID=A0A533QAF2_9BACT|nr:MAG: DNA-binding domain of ModE / Molybdate-binding domain of ModE [Candidatus Jettenia ecosi]
MVQGQIHAHVQILWKDIPLSVIITRASCEDMHLSVGDTISVLIKGTDIMLAKALSGMLSARNKARGIVRQIIQGDVLSKVFVESQGDMLHAIITNTSLREMNIQEGDEVTAIVKSTELILSKEV